MISDDDRSSCTNDLFAYKRGSLVNLLMLGGSYSHRWRIQMDLVHQDQAPDIPSSLDRH